MTWLMPKAKKPTISHLGIKLFNGHSSLYLKPTKPRRIGKNRVNTNKANLQMLRISKILFRKKNSSFIKYQ